MNNIDINKNPAFAVGLIVVCVLSTIASILAPPNPVQDFVSLPFSSVSTAYSCAGCLMILGVNMVMPITEDNIAGAVLVCCICSLIGSAIRASAMMKKDEKEEEDVTKDKNDEKEEENVTKDKKDKNGKKNDKKGKKKDKKGKK